MQHLDAGPELDALVAKMLELPETETIPIGQQGQGQKQFIPYSTDIAHAWTVLEKLRAFGWPNVGTEQTPPFKWCCALILNHFPWRVISEIADSAPLAICRAALRAVQYHQPATQTTPGA